MLTATAQPGMLSLPLVEAMAVLNTELAQDTAAAILTENTEGLRNLWLMSGETDKVKLISWGEAASTKMSANTYAEIFVKVYCSLKRGSIERRIAEINSMPPDKRNNEELAKLYVCRLLFPR